VNGLLLTGTDPMPYCERPCARCPWRRDTPPGEFPAERFERLRSTSPRPGADEPDWAAPMFACHKTRQGDERACAGWLATVAHRHLGVRLAVARLLLPGKVLRPGPGWPALFETYAEMEAAQARRAEV
jgi:hypothetical protein